LIATLKRFVKGPVRPQVAVVSGEVPAELARWLSGFSLRTQGEVQRLALEHNRVWWVRPHERLAEFRQSPHVALDAVAAVHRRLLREGADGELVVWCVGNRDEFGLTEAEAEVVFGAELNVWTVEAVRCSDRRHKLIVVGELRTDLFGVCLRVDSATGLSALRATALLGWMTSSAGVAPTIFVDRDVAQALADNRELPLARAVAETLERRDARLALWVPRAQTEQIIADPRGGSEPLRALGGAPIHLVAFEQADVLIEPATLWPRFAAEGFLADASLVLASGHGTGVYLRGGAYVPQPFDLTTPAGKRGDDVPVEVVRLDPSVPGAWARRFDDRRKKVAPLLDFERVVNFDRRLAADPLLAQRYHEFRVYNWPVPDPTPRTTLVDLGVASRPMAAIANLRRCVQRARRFGGVRFAAPVEWLAAARDEATRRLPASAQAALDDQRHRHEYLQQSQGTPLRADAVAFADFIAPSLGETLEIGAGFGDLARTLVTRATGYVCLDLEVDSVRAAIGSRGRGAIGDIHHLPFRDGTFDSVVANNVLEHAFDPRRALSEIARVLTDAGRLYALVPADARNADFELRAHHWKLSKASLERALRASGLALRRCEEFNLYKLGIAGSFPSCDGIEYAVEAARA
jgi:SAM-dependent methyltransferase